MATYKVWLKVKDSFGNMKEVDGGTINVDLNITDEDVDRIGQMALDSYVKKEDVGIVDSADIATDKEVEDAISKATHDTIKYTGFSD
jgi:hypothetical protein